MAYAALVTLAAAASPGVVAAPTPPSSCTLTSSPPEVTSPGGVVTLTVICQTGVPTNFAWSGPGVTPFTTASVRVLVNELSTFSVVASNAGGAAPPASVSVEVVSAPEPPLGSVTRAIEYYHAEFAHYSMTSDPFEIELLDSGALAGWVRTGEGFNVYALTPEGLSSVCRFFSTAFAPKSSHFFTASTTECDLVKENPDWHFEGLVFGVAVPTIAGDCPADTTPVFRLYNNGMGGAPNHRYTTSGVVRGQMISQGWTPEGYGSLTVIFCSPTR